MVECSLLLELIAEIVERLTVERGTSDLQKQMSTLLDRTHVE